MYYENVLTLIAEQLNREQICWALGGSLMLDYSGIENRANDIDILIKEDDIDHAVQILQSLGPGKRGGTSTPFCTKHFYQFKIQHIDIDIMAGLALNHQEGIYHVSFNRQSISGAILVRNEEIPLSALEDWYVIYQLIPGKIEKADRIESYFKRDGMQYRHLLKQALKQGLPAKVNNRIKMFDR